MSARSYSDQVAYEEWRNLEITISRAIACIAAVARMQFEEQQQTKLFRPEIFHRSCAAVNAIQSLFQQETPR